MSPSRRPANQTGGALAPPTPPAAVRPEEMEPAPPDPQSPTPAQGDEQPGRGGALGSNWFTDLMSGTEQAAKESTSSDLQAVLAKASVPYLVLVLVDDHLSISSWHADRIYEVLTKYGPHQDVLLILWSRGGSVEPAYQISKLCKKFSRNRFVVAVPRHAKSAATLITLGADEIHMGDLSELGPIDTQLYGLPALAVRDALRNLAELSHQFPGSGPMFAEYLTRSVSFQQIGYLDRIAVSASQYAERLLRTKTGLPDSAQAIAQRLVEGYKDHGFVIDADEAKSLLGTSLIVEGSPEIALADAVYQRHSFANFVAGLRTPSKQLALVGELGRPESVHLWDRLQRR